MDEYPNLEIELDINDPDYLPDGKSSKCVDSESHVCSPHRICQNNTNCKWLVSALGKRLLFGASQGE